MHFPASTPESRLSGPILFAFMVVSRKDLEKAVKRKVDSVKWFYRHLKVKVRICPDNHDLGALAWKCINNRTRGRSRKEAELIACWFRRRYLWGSKLHSGYSIPLRFYLEGALFGDDVEKFVSGLIIIGTSIWQVGRLLRWGFGVVPAIIYYCNAVPVILTKSDRKPVHERG